MIAMVATSCFQADVEDINLGEEGLVTFTINAPGIGSRAINDGTGATQLTYAIYDAEWKYLSQTTIDEAFASNLTEVISLRLVKNKTYNFVFWAQNPNANCYELSLGTTVGDVVAPTVEVKYGTAVANDETRDAFFGQLKGLTVDGTVNETVILTRPFAQINFATNHEDTRIAEAAGYKLVKDVVTSFTTRAYTELNLADGSVDGEQTVTFTATKNPSEPLVLLDESNSYDWLAMNYILVPANESSLSTCSMTAKLDGQQDITIEYPMAPAKRNWRTNLVGNLLTEAAVIEVKIDPVPEGEYPNTEDQKLAAIAAVGGVYTLTEDMELTNSLIVNGNLTLNLNGKTLSGEFSKDAGAIINNNATLTIVGGTINNTSENGAAVIYNNGDLVLDDVKIVGAPIGTAGYPEYAVYSVGGSLVVEDGVEIVADRGAIRMDDGADVAINGGKFVVTDAVGTRTLTTHVIYAKGSSSKLTINGGDFAMNIANGGGTSVICPAGATIKVYDGNFYHAPVVADSQSGCFQNYMGYGAPVDVYGGIYNDASVTKQGNIAEGYTFIEKDGLFVVTAAANNAETLATAIANGGLVSLTGDITTSEAIEIPAGTTATINLNGKTITATATDAIVAKAGADLTISGNGKVEAHSAPIRAIGGKVTVEGGEFIQTGDYYSTPSTLRYSVDSREGGEIIIKGGTFKTINGMINVNANSSVVIEGGNFENTVNSAITRHFAYVAGNLTIKDGVFKNVGNAGAGGTFFCGAGANGKVVVEGGKFTSLWASGSKNNIWESYYGGSIEVKGGLFNHNGGIKTQVTENTDAATKDAYPYMAK